MFYVSIDPDKNGWHGNPTSTPLAGRKIVLPDNLLANYIYNKGFVDLTIENNKVIDVTPNDAALSVYMETHPDKPRPKTDKEKLSDLSDQIASLTAQNEAYEELIVELAGVVYA